MKSSRLIVALVACVITAAALGAAVSSSTSTAPLRQFGFTYVAKIPALPADAKISRIWIPLPQSDRYQTIRNLKIEAPFPYTQRKDSEYGNEYLYFEVPASKVGEPAEVKVTFDVARLEHRDALDVHPVSAQSPAASADLQRYLQPDRLVPLQGVIADL